MVGYDWIYKKFGLGGGIFRVSFIVFFTRSFAQSLKHCGTCDAWEKGEQIAHDGAMRFYFSFLRVATVKLPCLEEKRGFWEHWDQTQRLIRQTQGMKKRGYPKLG
jgi:hypothetical protein